MSKRQLLENIWYAGVAQVGGYQAVKNTLSQIDDYKPSHIVAVGKAASAMARAALDCLDESLPCIVVTKYEHGEKELASYPNLTLIESAHPVPDDNSLRAGAELIKFVEGLPAYASLLVLASGGASSLVESLLPPSTLQDLKTLNEKMLASGMDIHAMNAERKKISDVKNGRLLARFKGQEIRSYLISDVEGDNISAIGSGIGLVDGAKVIASNAIARKACAVSAKDAGLHVVANEETLYGDVFDIAKVCAQKVLAGKDGLYIFGGEPVISLPKNPGEGGRNQALGVAMAKELSGHHNISVLVAGTDGSDGPTGSAGGYVTGSCWQCTAGGDAALLAADSGSWLRHLSLLGQGGLFVTGPTGTNVMDIMLVLKT